MKAEQFETVLMKHGEHGIQAILENWERFSGIFHAEPMSLERRWEIFLRKTDHVLPAVAVAA